MSPISLTTAKPLEHSRLLKEEFKNDTDNLRLQFAPTKKASSFPKPEMPDEEEILASRFESDEEIK
jgi:hypothetical protein